MADETWRKYHSGRYPEYEGGPGQASYEAGSKHGYYKKDERGQPIKSDVQKKATSVMDEIFGTSPSGIHDLRIKKALKESGVE